MPNRLGMSVKRDAAISVTRVSIGRKKLVYLLVADKAIKYKNGKSRIAYIGTTRNGVARIAQSAAARSEDILAIRGVRWFQARVVTCAPRRNVKSWKKLERGFLLCFRETFGEIPKCNSHGKQMKTTDEFYYFSKKRIMGIIDEMR